MKNSTFLLIVLFIIILKLHDMFPSYNSEKWGFGNG